MGTLVGVTELGIGEYGFHGFAGIGFQIRILSTSKIISLYRNRTLNSGNDKQTLHAERIKEK
jgi:hypothetical protein